MKYVDVSVSDIRIFQHIVLLVDRADFQEKAALVKLKLKSRPKNVREEYGVVPEEIHLLASEFQYPIELEPAIWAAVMKNEISDRDVRGYEPDRRTKQSTDKYKLHPILGLKVSPTIKRQRNFYLFNVDKNIHLGYRKLSGSSGISLSTVQTEIKSYARKLSIPPPSL